LDLRNIIKLLVFSFLFCSCGKSNLELINAKSIPSQKGKNVRSNDSLECKDVKGRVNLDCIYKKAFHGNNEAIEYVYNRLVQDPIKLFISQGRDRRMRRERLFDLALKTSKNFRCDLGIEWVIGPAFKSAVPILFDMIENVDNQEPSDYISNILNGYKLERDINCTDEMLYKAFWNELNTAWQEGKIKLKDFGQE
jgi:hypothetical protein